MRALLLTLYFLTSDQADYDGKNLIFSGKFQVEHPMGVLKAEKATLQDLQLHQSGKTGSRLFLEEGVSIESTRGKTPFTIKSMRASCGLPPHLFFSLFQFQELEFFDNVEIATLHEIRATGGYALYKTGSLTLFPSVPSSHCRLFRGSDAIDAKEIRFDLFNEELHCATARGQIAPRGGRLPLNFSSHALFWNKREQRISLSQDVHIEEAGQFSIYSDTASFHFEDDTHLNLCVLEGRVRLYSPRIQDKPSFSIADKIEFDPITEKLILSAIAPNRVLFWQEGFSLSAPEIYIARDPLTHKETIQGKGDVHFAFEPKEKNMIEELIAKYL